MGSIRAAVITGASRGIGAGLAKAFAREGIALGLCARSPCPKPDGVRCVTSALDVTHQEQVGEFALKVSESLGPIDLWINNAGVLDPIKQFRCVATDEFERHLAINVMGVVNGSQAYLRHLVSRSDPKRGVLINISSGAGRHPYSGWAAYCAGKAAVDRLTEVIALEEVELLSAYAVAPGVVDTEMQTQIRAADPTDFPAVERFWQMKRDNSFSTMEDVAQGILALHRDGSDSVLVDLRSR